MKIKLSIWCTLVDGESPKQIFDTDVSNNPFSVGDIVNVTVEKLTNKNRQFAFADRICTLNDSDQMVKGIYEYAQKHYDNISIRIESIHKFLEISPLGEDTLRIECQAVKRWSIR